MRSKQEAAAAQVAGCRMHDGESKAGGYGGVDCVAAFAQDLHAGVRGQVMDADDHAVARAHGLLAAIGEHVRRALLCREGIGREG